MAMEPRRFMERKTRFELATLSLARRCSTTEPLPLAATAHPRPWRGVDGAEGQNRTVDTGIFSAVLYLLSYLGLQNYIKTYPSAPVKEALRNSAQFYSYTVAVPQGPRCIERA
jgi:hypothetical protein